MSQNRGQNAVGTATDVPLENAACLPNMAVRRGVVATSDEALAKAELFVATTLRNPSAAATFLPICRVMRAE